MNILNDLFISEPLRDCGWLHQSSQQQQQQVLPGPALQRQQELHHREHQEAYWEG